ncbi:hypothetical protein FHR83_003221 [Actinoplanes campanulatus]|uniref:Uncharacterized protein n=1 Tax=Actinoplanes campanulatus TaxID=113559 RepID=A0A7W5AFU8_9ACTN|nr:hypothetical protein [Actinoplanes campanulatus]MBB3095551.1 hypothetical protein [Actinoplanes campanulatus]GGN09790.1 hypothetical protein GCM10010109_19230 [Actinoplanes campanulatus]GID36441.1 hypothetical protein Aca09nite_29470 [Actinoplanes campanulatus]
MGCRRTGGTPANYLVNLEQATEPALEARSDTRRRQPWRSPRRGCRSRYCQQ